MREWVRNRPFLAFYAMAFGLATIVWLYILGMEIALADSRPGGFSLFASFYQAQAELVKRWPVLHHHGDSVLLYVATYAVVPLACIAFFFPFAPTLASLSVTAAGWGKAGLRALVGAYRPVRGNIGWQEGARIYAVIFGFLALLAAISVLRVFLSGDAPRVSHFLTYLGVIDWRYLTVTWLVALFLNQGALLEELGWRGFALPLVIRRLGSPLAGAALVGVAWTFWHLPRELPALMSGQQTLAALAVGQLWFLILCVSASIIMAYFVNITGGSVVPAIMIHGGMNFIGGMLAQGSVGPRSAFSADGPLTWAAAAMLLLILVGRDLGWRKRLAAHDDAGPGDPSLLWSAPSRER